MNLAIEVANGRVPEIDEPRSAGVCRRGCVDTHHDAALHQDGGAPMKGKAVVEPVGANEQGLGLARHRSTLHAVL